MSDLRRSVSVALCTYNGERYVEEQLGSILAQSTAVREIVVSDDASSDGTIALVEKAAAAMPGDVAFQLLRNAPGLGVVRNFEQAVSATTAEIVALSDQDDVWHPDKLDTVLGVLEAHPEVAFVHTDARLVDADGAPLGSTLFDYLEVSADVLDEEESARGFETLLRRNLATGATVVFRRSLLEQALPFPEEWVHDEWLAVIAAATARVGVVRRPTVDYRLHGSNEIGVAAPTLRNKVGRVLDADGSRNRLLAAKFAVLAERLRALDVAPSLVELADAKAAFERRRAELPSSRPRRVPTVLRMARAGLYGSFASQGRMDVVRDLLRRP
ncbi:glycosyltransferase family 2 protein [Leifsonia sp. NPDC058194]|uniref:glycosyltransferase family 2 protein n=1 Tax=Leifsonia sp. NPDC058194 TaxID=3346374 RepID=UPI0036DE5DA1